LVLAARGTPPSRKRSVETWASTSHGQRRALHLGRESRVHCDALVSLPKPMLTDYVASLKPSQLRALDHALRVAPALA
jgi:mRNA-degrading endonuclease toxin of MazEF toxin-antitoxin module